jgi:hypothetical protein
MGEAIGVKDRISPRRDFRDSGVGSYPDCHVVRDEAKG